MAKSMIKRRKKNLSSPLDFQPSMCVNIQTEKGDDEKTLASGRGIDWAETEIYNLFQVKKGPCFAEFVYAQLLRFQEMT